MRILLCAFVSSALSAGCWAGRAHVTPLPLGPGRYVLDSGTAVRVRLGDSHTVSGFLLSPFAPDSEHLRLCERHFRPCASPSALGVRIFPTGAIRRLEVPGSVGPEALAVGFIGWAAAAGFALAKGSVSGRPVGDPPLLTGVGLGLTLGAIVAVWVPAWEPLIPCGRLCVAGGEYHP